MEVIEARPCSSARRCWSRASTGTAWEDGATGLPGRKRADGPALPNLPGPHQIVNAGAALMALRHLGAHMARPPVRARDAGASGRRGCSACARGPLVEAAAPAELWLDGGHNPAAGEAVAATLAAMPGRPRHLVCGMLSTKDIAGYLRPLAARLSASLGGRGAGRRSDPARRGHREAARAEGIAATTAADPLAAVQDIAATRRARAS